VPGKYGDILKIRQAGEAVLRQPARALSPGEIGSPAVQDLIERMHETMRDAPGVGLAAPQVGVGLQIAVIEDRQDYHQALSREQLGEMERKPIPFHVLINPHLTVVGQDTALFFEGCLSVAGFTALVPRATRVQVSAYDEKGEPVLIDATGWYARILQHETDHLQGRLYVDTMLTRSFMSSGNHARHWKQHPIDEVCRRLGIKRPPA